MKKLMVLLLAGLLLMGAVACQPTPEQEYVVNKKDSGAAAKLSGWRTETGYITAAHAECRADGHTHL